MTDDELRALIGETPDPANPLTGAQIRALAQQHEASLALRPLFALAAAIVLSAGLIALALQSQSEPELSPRGVEAHGQVTLSWVVEGGAAPRVAVPTVGPQERVIFRVGTTAPGFLCIFEEGPAGFVRVVPESGSWAAEPGEHVPRINDQIAAFVTDLGPGSHRYRAAFDRGDPACLSPEATATTTLDWTIR
jgi:hypothetical protein